jgi:hypothetical protein
MRSIAKMVMFQANTIRAVHRLLDEGEVQRSSLQGLQAGERLGLWRQSFDGSRCVARDQAVKLMAALPSKQEAAASVFACEEEVRQEWLRVTAARMKELGARRDAQGLCDAVSVLGGACDSVRKALPAASLSSTPYSDLELELFGAPIEQGVATPKLLRVVGATAEIVGAGTTRRDATLADVDPLDPSINWVNSRLIRPANLNEPAPDGRSAVLSGSLQSLTAGEADATGINSNATMHWVLARPWAFLLAQIVFTQEAWRAERISGSLSLEIEESHVSRFNQPPQVLVAVTTPLGDEIVCGSLGELIRRVLSGLGVSILAGRLTPGELNDLLAPVIQELLTRKVWRFNHRGVTGQRPNYAIHETFSDACYRSMGSKYFYRLGSKVTGMIRIACERWAEEQLARARGSRAGLEITPSVY